jgi:hypothetical protein
MRESLPTAPVEAAPLAATPDHPSPAGAALLSAPVPLAAGRALALQRAAGNRTVSRLAAAPRVLARDVYSTDAKRAMKEGKEAAGYKPDIEVTDEKTGILWDWDPFDRTLTLFTPVTSAAQGMAVRLTYAEGSTPDIPALLAANDLTKEQGVVNSEMLSPLRAKGLLWLKKVAGTYQEKEGGAAGEKGRKERVENSVTNWIAGMDAWAADQKVDDKTRAERKARVDAYKAKLGPMKAAAAAGNKLPETPEGAPLKFAKVTMCNVHVGDYTREILGVSLGGMDPRQQVIDKERAGSFRTMMSDPFKPGEFRKGPQAGDVISYGMAGKAAKKDGLRFADFGQIMHIGVLKSRRPGEGGTEIWTVVDGGQGGFDSRQETRERVRIFSIEKMTANLMKATTTGKAAGPEMEAGRIKTVDLDVGVFEGKPNDYILRGWLDIDAYAGGKSEALPEGAGSKIFTQKKK